MPSTAITNLLYPTWIQHFAIEQEEARDVRVEHRSYPFFDLTLWYKLAIAAEHDVFFKIAI